MPLFANEDADMAPMSAEARNWWPDEAMVRADGGRRVELVAAGVLLRSPIMWLADIFAVVSN